MMKTTMSLAVLALISETSAVELKNHHKHHHQLHHRSTHSHPRYHLAQHRRPKTFTKKSKDGQNGEEDSMYKSTAAGVNWFDLDDPTERLHGTEEQDENHEDDPDVVDAPEDIPRVGNAHETLHNAVIQPDGYENGFTVKDAFGNYAQVSRRNQQYALNQMRQRNHHQRKHHNQMRRHNFVQDHANDTEDILPEYSQVMYEHEDDTDDIPDGFDPLALNQIREGFQRGSALEAMQNLELQQTYWQQPEHEENEGEFIQQQYEHDDDTEDIPNGLDPITLVRARHHSFNQDVGQISLLGEQEDIQQQGQSDEIQAIMDKQAQEDAMKVQIGQTGMGFMPHEDDTEDMALDQSPAAYDYHHSKQWNDEVNRKAVQIENEIKIEENTKIAKKKSLAQAKTRAAEERIKNAALAKKKAADAVPVVNKFQTVDFSELYSGIPATENLMTDYEFSPYEHHSKFVQQVNWKADALVERQAQQAAYEEAHPDEFEQGVHYATVDQGALYDGLAVQEGYEHHSEKFYKHQSEMDKLADQQIEAEDAAIKATEASPAMVQKYGMNPEALEVRHPNPDVDLGDEYAGFGSFVQLNFDHELDSDDIVPEFSEAIKISVEKKAEVELKNDFNGQKFEEFYDE